MGYYLEISINLFINIRMGINHSEKIQCILKYKVLRVLTHFETISHYAIDYMYYDSQYFVFSQYFETFSE